MGNYNSNPNDSFWFKIISFVVGVVLLYGFFSRDGGHLEESPIFWVWCFCSVISYITLKFTITFAAYLDSRKNK